VRAPTVTLPSWCPNYINFPSTPRLKYLISYVSGQDERVRSGTLGRSWLSTGSIFANSETYRITGHYVQVKALPICHIRNLAHIKGEAFCPAGMSPMIDAQLLPNYATFPDPTDQALSRILFLLYNTDYSRHIVTGRENWDAFQSLLFHFDSSYLAYEDLESHFSDVKQGRNQNKDFQLLGNSMEVRCPRYKIFDEEVAEIDSKRFSADSVFQTLKLDKIRKKAKRKRLPSLDVQASISALSNLIAKGLRLMTTSQSNVGWAHPDVELRDEIFLLPGCSMPVILRRQEGPLPMYLVFGHAYVDGYMDGQFWKSVTLSKQLLRDIWLV
jgi:hypothetical protein